MLCHAFTAALHGAFLRYSQADIEQILAYPKPNHSPNPNPNPNQADIEQILEGSTTVRHSSTAVGGSVFSKVTHLHATLAYLPC